MCATFCHLSYYRLSMQSIKFVDYHAEIFSEQAIAYTIHLYLFWTLTTYTVCIVSVRDVFRYKFCNKHI